jgi:nicotinamide-nucleotide amidase
MQEVNASIITIGDELLIGQTVDTNSAFIGTELNKIGVWVKRRIAVGDIKEDILQTLEEQSKSTPIIIITGGLGPTADDITKPALCEYFGSQLVVSEEALQNVKDIFARLDRPLIERNIKQAEVPHNCTVLNNTRGTAPGMWFEKDGVVYISLPGVPHEMKGLMELSVIPRLKEHFTLPAVLHRTLLTAGKGESEIAELLKGFEAALPSNIKLAYLPSYGMVRLRLTGRAESSEPLSSELDRQFTQLKALVREWMVIDEDITIELAVGRMLKQRGKTLATAESCTGGYIAHLITSHSGSSQFFLGTVVSYANEVKKAVLGVQEATLSNFGAVSEQTVSEMAAGALKTLKTDYAIATSGIMGPEGGTPDKPVGTVWIAVAGPKGVRARKHFFRFDRRRNIEMAAATALNMLRVYLAEEESN